jgi:hypothetical protein
VRSITVQTGISAARTAGRPLGNSAEWTRSSTAVDTKELQQSQGLSTGLKVLTFRSILLAKKSGAAQALLVDYRHPDGRGVGVVVSSPSAFSMLV